MFQNSDTDIIDNYDDALREVNRNGLRLEFVSEELKNNEGIVRAAILSNHAAFDFASERLKQNQVIMDLSDTAFTAQAVPFRANRLHAQLWHLGETEDFDDETDEATVDTTSTTRLSADWSDEATVDTTSTTRLSADWSDEETDSDNRMGM